MKFKDLHQVIILREDKRFSVKFRNFVAMKFKCEDLVSVIVPVYNVERYLRDCVDSVLNQSYHNIEVILVDDGSTDSSPELCDSFTIDPRVSVIHQQNGGLSAARNSGIKAATGNWLVFIDSDDYLTSLSAIETWLSLAYSSGAEIVTTPISNKKVTTRSLRSRIIDGNEAAEIILYQTASAIGLSCSACGKLFRAELFSAECFREGLLYEDLDLIPRIAASCRRVCASNAAAYFYRENPQSILGKFNPQRFDALDICARLVDYFAPKTQIRKAAEDRLLSASFNMLMLMGRHGYEDKAHKRECVDNIKGLRLNSLLNPRVRFRNKAGIIISYLLGPGAFCTPFMARFLTR